MIRAASCFSQVLPLVNRSDSERAVGRHGAETGVTAHENGPHLLGRVVVWDAQNARKIVLLSNTSHIAASTVAASCRDRWRIELFFKALKHNFQGQSLHGHERERRQAADLDSTDRDVVAEVHAVEILVAALAVEPGGDGAIQSFDVPRPVGMARRAVPDARGGAAARTGPPLRSETWTASNGTSPGPAPKPVSNALKPPFYRPKDRE